MSFWDASSVRLLVSEPRSFAEQARRRGLEVAKEVGVADARGHGHEIYLRRDFDPSPTAPTLAQLRPVGSAGPSMRVRKLGPEWLVAPLVTDVDRKAELVTVVWSATVHRQAMEHDDVTQLVVGRGPSGIIEIHIEIERPCSAQYWIAWQIARVVRSGEDTESLSFLITLCEGNPDSDGVRSDVLNYEVLVGAGEVATSRGRRWGQPSHLGRVAKDWTSKKLRGEHPQPSVISEAVKLLDLLDMGVDRGEGLPRESDIGAGSAQTVRGREPAGVC